MPTPLLNRFRLRNKNKTLPLPAQKRWLGEDGRVRMIPLGTTRSAWGDLYHLLLMLSWPSFLGLISGFYGLANALFALGYVVDPNGIANAQPGSFADAFFFSIQTMASIGYGAMYPQTLYTNLLVTIESLLGLLGLAMATGLMFARFARPTARVMFSQVAVIAPHEQLPTLMFRAANQRQNQILEAQIRATLIRNEITAEGQFMRRFYDLALVRSQTPVFALTWTVMHPINAQSPLYGLTAEALTAMEAEIVVTLMGLDETFSQTISARHSYLPSEIFENMRLADILTRLPNGRRAIDYRRFHEVVPLESQLTRQT